MTLATNQPYDFSDGPQADSQRYHAEPEADRPPSDGIAILNL
jgi:hypothetical protein